MTTLFDFISLVASYLRMNFFARLEYRGAFFFQVMGMFINDGVWLAFWVYFFTRFPILNGWRATDIITLWTIGAAGFGLAHTVAGNGWLLPKIIVNGELDAWMLYPRALLSHILIGKMSPTAFGDALFGYVVYVAFVKPDLVHFAMFVLLTLSIAVLWMGFSVLTGSLTFYVGNGDALSAHWRGAMINFSTYPMPLFHGFTKLLLLTIIPAGFVNYFPVMALRNLSLVDLGITFAGSCAVLVIGTCVFYHGLNKYESGNLMEMRG